MIRTARKLALAVAIVATGLVAVPALASAPAGANTTLSYSYSSQYQYFTVPAGVTSLYITVAGGSGANGQGNYGGGAGGAGGEIRGDLPVTPGEQLTLWVGGAGQPGGGAGYGNPAHTDFMGGTGGSGYGPTTGAGGGGGAASYIICTSQCSGLSMQAVGGGGGGGGGGGIATGGSGGAGSGGGTTGAGQFSNGWDASAGPGSGTYGANPGQANASGSNSGANGFDASDNCCGYWGGGGGGGGGGYATGGTGNGQSGSWSGGGSGQGNQSISGYGGAGGAGGNSYGNPAMTNVSFVSSGFAASVAGQITITYLTPSTTTLTPTSSSIYVGQSVRLNAFVSPTDGGGTVTFTSNGTAISGCSNLPFTSGGGTDWAVSCTTSSLPVGSDNISANYSGDSAYGPSSGTTTVTVSQYATTTSLAASSSNVGPSTPVTFTATVSGTDGGGTVTFSTQNGTTILCQNHPLTASGSAYQATCTQSLGNLGPGTYTVTASYSGDTLYAPSSGTTTVTVYPTLSITTTSLPPGTVGQAYSATVSASGGSGAYNWSLASGALPEGLSLSSSGTISGTPARNQTASFTVEATDTTTGQTATRALSITVTGGSSAPLIIQGLRLAGPGGSADDYVELYNPTSGPVNLNGWQLGYGDSSSSGSVQLPADSIPAGGHFLIAGSQYSLGSYESPDFSLGVDLPADGGIQLVAPNATVTDAVGVTTAPAAYREGSGLPTPTQTGAQLAFQRTMANGAPTTDTTSNAADFVLVATDANTNNHGAGAVLGAPAPQNVTSRIDANTMARSTLLDLSESASGPDNRSYDASTGTLTIRRTITNMSSSQSITALWLRITNITTYGTATANQAILTVQSSTNQAAPDGTPLAGATIDQPPSQPSGGGLGTSLLIDVGDGGLAPGQSVNVVLQFHVVRGGQFSVGYNAEVGTAP